MKYPSLDYDKLVEGFRDKLRGNIESKVMTEAETQKEIADVTDGVFIEPVPIITPTGPELDLIAHGLETGNAFVPVKKRRGRPPGSHNRPKVK